MNDLGVIIGAFLLTGVLWVLLKACEKFYSDQTHHGSDKK